MLIACGNGNLSAALISNSLDFQERIAVDIYSTGSSIFKTLNCQSGSKAFLTVSEGDIEKRCSTVFNCLFDTNACHATVM